jgi:hypothetical protein
LFRKKIEDWITKVRSLCLFKGVDVSSSQCVVTFPSVGVRTALEDSGTLFRKPSRPRRMQKFGLKALSVQ